ncbi:hypothetical protein HED60_18200 [Planctomycetales bacterium ZRK34]|nr:hypothetical protein HED60_18200 [Planctomycetales bacterium ZRK34]
MKIPAGRVTGELCTTMDLYATFASLGGATLPTDRSLDSLDMADFWLGRADRSPRDTYYFYSYSFLQAVRQGPWKLIVPRPNAPRWTSWYAHTIDDIEDYELYNVDHDISELHNVAADHPDVISQLKALYESARNELGDYDRVGADARFFDADPPAPVLHRRAAPV